MKERKKINKTEERIAKGIAKLKRIVEEINFDGFEVPREVADNMTLDEIAKGTGLPRRQAMEAVKVLEGAGIIKLHKTINA